MAVVVVATTLVREARSKSVVGVTAEVPLLAKDARAPAFGVVDLRSKSPPFGKLRAGSSRKEREKDGAPAFGVTRPRAFRAIRLPWCVTAIEAAGKAFWFMASCRMAKAAAKTSSWFSKASCRVDEGWGAGIERSIIWQIMIWHKWHSLT